MKTVADAKLPLVSILIVTWNRKECLNRCIDSALAQDYEPKEVVVVDNDSSDGTAEMLMKRYPDIRLICSYTNLGCPLGRNLGFANCRGDYIYLLDDDGWLKEDAVSRSVERAMSDNSIGVVMSALHEIGDGEVKRIRPAEKNAVYLGDFVGCCSLLSRKALDMVGVFPSDFFRQAEEQDLAIRLLDVGKTCFFEPSSIMYHGLSPIGRDKNKFLYLYLRNTNKTALRIYPFPYNILKILVNTKYAFCFAFSHADLKVPIFLFGCLVRDCLQLKGKRAPVRRKTFVLFRKLQKHPSRTKPVLD